MDYCSCNHCNGIYPELEVDPEEYLEYEYQKYVDEFEPSEEQEKPLSFDDWLDNL